MRAVLLFALALNFGESAFAKDYSPEEKACALSMVRNSKIVGSVTGINIKSAGGKETASRLIATFQSALIAAREVDDWSIFVSPKDAELLNNASNREGDNAANDVFVKIFVSAGFSSYDLTVDMTESGLSNTINGVCLIDYRRKVFAVPAP